MTLLHGLAHGFRWGAWLALPLSAQSAQKLATKEVVPPSIGGAWGPSLALPISSNGELVHAIYLPPHSVLPNPYEGHVLLVTNQYPNCNAPLDPTDHSRLLVWDPATSGSIEIELDVPNGQDDSLWCSGHALAPSGDVWFFGGTDFTQTCYTGSTGVYRWDPNGVTAAGSLHPLGARWYPSILELGTSAGDLLIFGHTSQPIGPQATHQLLSIATGDVSQLFDNNEVDADHQPTGQSIAFMGYSWAHWTVGGEVFVAGPVDDRKYMGVRLPGGAFGWQSVAPSAIKRIDGNSVHLLDWMPQGRRERIYIVGGMTELMGPGAMSGSADWFATATMESIETPVSSAHTTWKSAPSMRHNRRHATALPLPDGSFLVVGGVGWEGPPDTSGREVPRLRPERFDPVTGTWTRMNAQRDSRNYHSTAFLLADGRVVSAGGIDSDHTLEIFSPPYLFLGPRPVITSLPGTLAWCASAPPGCATFLMQVQLGDSGDALTAVRLLRPASVTHGIDCNQRAVELPIIIQDIPDPEGAPLLRDLYVQLPESPSVAPPGWYLAFAVSAAGIPSAGQFVRVQ